MPVQAAVVTEDKLCLTMSPLRHLCRYSASGWIMWAFELGDQRIALLGRSAAPILWDVHPPVHPPASPSRPRPRGCHQVYRSVRAELTGSIPRRAGCSTHRTPTRAFRRLPCLLSKEITKIFVTISEPNC